MKWTPKTLAITAGVVVVGAWYLKRQAGQALASAGQAVNPVNPNNVFSRGVNEVGGAISGDENFSLGAWLWEISNPDKP